MYCGSFVSQQLNVALQYTVVVDSFYSRLLCSGCYLYFSYSELRQFKVMKSPTQTETNHPVDKAEHHSPLSHKDAEAASPEDSSVCGEEDPGSALESMVDDDK